MSTRCHKAALVALVLVCAAGLVASVVLTAHGNGAAANGILPGALGLVAGVLALSCGSDAENDTERQDDSIRLLLYLSN